MPAALIARNENTVLLRRNACQFTGSVLDDSTCLLAPFSLLLRVSAFKLSGTYLSQTISNLATCRRCDVMYDKKTSVEMSCTRFQHIDDSSTIKDRACVTLSLTGIRYCKQLNKSDFVPLLKTLICEIAGGQARFSCLKNSSRSPLHTCEAMYNLEKSEQLFVDVESCSVVCLTSL